MSTVKISELPEITHLNTDTTQSLAVGVDLATGTTGKYTLKTLAEGLYSNDVLNVGNNAVTLPNTVAQFAASGGSYIQTNLVNNNDGGSADIVITASANSGGTDSSNFIDMGYANKFYQPGQEYNNISTAIDPLDGYLYVQGTAASNGGNLIIGTTTSNTVLRFMVGGGTAKNVVAKMTSTGLVLNTQSSLTFSDGSVQSVAGAPASYTQSAFDQANVTIGINTTQNNRMTIIEGVDLGQNTTISATNGKMQVAFDQANNTQNIAQAAFLKANNSLANTAGVFTAGDFNISGNLTVLGVGTTGVMTINAAPFAANTPAFRITGTANGYSYAPLNQGYMIQVTGFANTSSRIVNDSWGANTYPAYIGRQGRGSALAPASTANGDIMLRIAGNGWGNSFSQFGQSRIDFVATENFTDSNKGTEIQIWNTTAGTNTLNKIAIFNSTELTITGQFKPLKGFVWYPRTFPAAQTAITLDFSTDAVIRTNMATGLTVSFANYTAGKVVDMWITNTAGTNQTFTHGCTALNSTVNATTYTIPGTSTIYVKYISFGTDVGNTFVSIVHA